MIVNEFGAVGIDAVALQSSAAAAGGTVTVKQIAGGCMCCAQSGVLLPAIAQIIRQTKPDRLLIEPSGLGHPAGDSISLSEQQQLLCSSTAASALQRQR